MKHSEERGRIDRAETALLERTSATERIDSDSDRAGAAEKLLARGVDDKVLLRANASERDDDRNARDIERESGGNIRVNIQLQIVAGANGADGGNTGVVEGGARGDGENVEEIAVGAVNNRIDVDAPAKEMRSDAKRFQIQTSTL
jgi:hypothetical protein